MKYIKAYEKEKYKPYDINTYVLVNSDALKIFNTPMKILEFNSIFYRCKNLYTNINHYISKEEIIRKLSYDETQQILSQNKFNL